MPLINVIPNGGRLAEAGALLLGAEENPAPEGWLHVAVGLLLQSQPDPTAIDGDAYRCAVADGAFQDPEIWGAYQPGFSAAVVVRSIRKVNREYDTLPSPGFFVNICIGERAWFKKMHADIGTLMDLRFAAEDALEEIGKPLLLEQRDEDDLIPF